jgi:hypothetical protein
VKSVVVYLVLQVGILIFLAVTAPAVVAVAIGGWLVIGWAFYLVAKWLGLLKQGGDGD